VCFRVRAHLPRSTRTARTARASAIARSIASASAAGVDGTTSSWRRRRRVVVFVVAAHGTPRARASAAARSAQLRAVADSMVLHATRWTRRRGDGG
jgi:hypothetical protein